MPAQTDQETMDKDGNIELRDLDLDVIEQDDGLPQAV